LANQTTTASQPAQLALQKAAAPLMKGGNGLMMLGLLAFLIFASLHKNTSMKGKGAVWASPKHKKHAMDLALKQIKRKKTNEVGVILDTVERIAMPHLQTSCLFVGKPKIGKTYFGINPTLKKLIDRGDSILLFDYKYPDQTSQILSYANEKGYKIEDISVFAPSYEEGCVFNIVNAATPEYASTLAETMVRNFTKTTDKDPFFGPAGIQLTEATLMLARELGGDIITAQAILSLEKLTARIIAARDRMSPDTYATFGQFLASAGSEKTAASIAGTASINFNKFAKAHIAPSFIGESTLPLRLEGKKLVVLGCRYAYRQTILPIMAAVAQLIIDSNVFPGRKTPLACVFDEFPTLYLGAFQEQINAIRSYGVFFLIGIQNLAQLALTYGKDEARSILAAIGTKHVYNPGDDESAELFSKMIGDTLTVVQSQSIGTSGGKRSSNRSPHREWRRLISPNEILSFVAGQRIIFNEGVGTDRKGFIPYMTSTPPNDAAKAAFAMSEANWPHAQKILVETNRKQPYSADYLRYQREMVEAVLPIPSGEKQSDVYLQSAINAFA
jgi:type IV secretory pathway TraG/TraD family ATPase VirD4